MVVREIYMDIPSKLVETDFAVQLKLLTAPGIPVFSAIG